jgi:hypothetical protein
MPRQGVNVGIRGELLQVFDLSGFKSGGHEMTK